MAGRWVRIARSTWGAWAAVALCVLLVFVAGVRFGRGSRGGGAGPVGGPGPEASQDEAPVLDVFVRAAELVLRDGRSVSPAAVVQASRESHSPVRVYIDASSRQVILGRLTRELQKARIPFEVSDRQGVPNDSPRVPGAPSSRR